MENLAAAAAAASIRLVHIWATTLTGNKMDLRNEREMILIDGNSRKNKRSPKKQHSEQLLGSVLPLAVGLGVWLHWLRSYWLQLLLLTVQTGCTIFSRQEGEEESQGLLVLRVLVCKESRVTNRKGKFESPECFFSVEKKRHSRWNLHSLGAVYRQLARQLLAFSLEFCLHFAMMVSLEIVKFTQRDAFRLSELLL